MESTQQFALAAHTAGQFTWQINNGEYAGPVAVIPYIINVAGTLGPQESVVLMVQELGLQQTPVAVGSPWASTYVAYIQNNSEFDVNFRLDYATF